MREIGMLDGACLLAPSVAQRRADWGKSFGPSVRVRHLHTLDDPLSAEIIANKYDKVSLFCVPLYHQADGVSSEPDARNCNDRCGANHLLNHMVNVVAFRMTLFFHSKG